MEKKEKIIGFYYNVDIDEVYKDNIYNDDLTYCANYWVTDKGSLHGNAHNYTVYYSNHFSELKKKGNIDLFEIGAARGSSLKMWNSWFKNINIDSIDNNPKCKNICKKYDNINIIIDDVLKFRPSKEYDIIIDDGCHLASYIIKAFNNLWKHVKKGGYYVIEDINSCSDDEYIKCVLRHSDIEINDELVKNNNNIVLNNFITSILTDKDKKIKIYNNKIVFIYKL